MTRTISILWVQIWTIMEKNNWLYVTAFLLIAWVAEIKVTLRHWIFPAFWGRIKK